MTNGQRSYGLPSRAIGIFASMCSYDNLKKLYKNQVMEMHPDRGGDPEMFRSLQESWETVEKMFEQPITRQ
jgi:hypothetical protein